MEFQSRMHRPRSLWIITADLILWSQNYGKWKKELDDINGWKKLESRASWLACPLGLAINRWPLMFLDILWMLQWLFCASLTIVRYCYLGPWASCLHSQRYVWSASFYMLTRIHKNCINWLLSIILWFDFRLWNLDLYVLEISWQSLAVQYIPWILILLTYSEINKMRLILETLCTLKCLKSIVAFLVNSIIINF